jgi:hypothetical protein
VVLGIYAVLLVVMSVAAHFIWGTGHAAVARDLEAAMQGTKRTNDALASVRAEIAKAQEVQRTIQLVTDGPDWGLLIDALGREFGDDAVMKEARLSVHAPAVAGAGPVKPTAATRTRYKLELRGLARSQAGVSRLVSRMETAGVFEEVKLNRTGREGFLNSTAVSFEIECAMSDQPGR